MAEENTEETAVATEEITTVVVGQITISTEEPAVTTSDITQELVPMMARGCHVDTWTDPRNLTEQLALEAAMSNPTIGVQLPITLFDPRWPSSGDGININILETDLIFTMFIT